MTKNIHCFVHINVQGAQETVSTLKLKERQIRRPNTFQEENQNI